MEDAEPLRIVLLWLIFVYRRFQSTGWMLVYSATPVSNDSQERNMVLVGWPFFKFFQDTLLIILSWQRNEILPLFKSNGWSCKKLVPDLPEEDTLKNTKTKALDCFHLYRFRCMMTCVWCRWTMDGANYVNQFDIIAIPFDAEYNSLVTMCQRPNKQSITYPLIWSI